MPRMGPLLEYLTNGPRTVSYWVNRPEEEQCVKEAIERGEIVFIGPRGCGKTQLCRRVARKFCKIRTKTIVQEIDGTCMQEMSRILQKCNQGVHTDQQVLLILDGVSQVTQSILFQLRQVKPKNWTFMMTTLDESMSQDPDTVVKVKGFTYRQFCSLIDNLTKGKDEDLISENLKEDFYNVLEGNPLDLYYAVKYLKKTQKSDEAFLKSLQDGHACALQNESALFQENEYKSSLPKALQDDILKIKESLLKDCPLTYDALLALTFFDHKNIPMEAFDAVFDGNKSYSVADTLLSAVSTYSLGTVTRVEDDGCRLLTLKKAFHRALISKVGDEETKQKSLELAYKVLLHLCHKDNRGKADYQSQINIEPHIKAVLDQKVVKKSIGVTLLNVWLLSTLGHYYIQTGQVPKGETELKRAIKIIEEDFLNKKVKLDNLTEADVPLLFELSQTDEADAAIREFVQSLRISHADKAKWSGRVHGIDRHIGSTVISLTSELHENLVEHSCAYEVNNVVPYFFAELVATVLYTYGRIFLYNHLEKNSKMRALEVCKMICQKVEATYDVKLLHTVLVDRNGLLCFKLSKEENENRCPCQTKQDAADAYHGYEEMLEKSCDRYEYGLLKAIQNEEYHRVVCSRYMLKASTVRYKHTEDDEERTMYKRQIEEFIRRLDGTLGDRGSHIGNLQRNTSMQMEIARALMMLNDWDHARDRFLAVCDAESKCKKINYPWMEALEGLCKLAKKWQLRDSKKSLEIGKRALKEILQYIRRSDNYDDLEDYNDNKQAAGKLQEDVKSLLKQLQHHDNHNLDSYKLLSTSSSLSSNIDVNLPCDLDRCNILIGQIC